MCTVVILCRPGHPWPLLLAANRDERLDRAWDPPGPWWPGLIGGRDRSGGGTWMALGRAGVVAAVLNRPGSLGPAGGKRSRGELPLLAAAAGSAEAGAARIAALDAGDWRPFNMVVADRDTAWFLRGLGRGRPERRPLPEGVTMVTAHDPDDLASPRVRRHLPRFRAAAPPEPETVLPDACANGRRNTDHAGAAGPGPGGPPAGWGAWEALLADAAPDADGNPAAALRVPPTGGFGTVCASLLALGADGNRVWRFAPGPAGTVPFAEVPTDPGEPGP